MKGIDGIEKHVQRITERIREKTIIYQRALKTTFVLLNELVFNIFVPCMEEISMTKSQPTDYRFILVQVQKKNSIHHMDEIPKCMRMSILSTSSLLFCYKINGKRMSNSNCNARFQKHYAPLHT